MSFENFRPTDIPPESRMECGVCWTVFDPAEGDPVWQVAPGTPFSALSPEWRCPNCDAPREKFLRLCDGR
jgi:rubredoxin